MKKYLITFLFIITCIFSCFSCGTTGNTGGSEQESNPIQSEEGSSESQKETITASAKIMSINIAGQDMTLPENASTVKYTGQSGEDYTYEKRRARLDALIGEYNPDVLYLQEVNGSNWWWPYLVTNADSFLNTFKNYTLVGRTNRVGGSEGAGNVWYDLYNQLYYDNQKFEEVASGMFYLNVKRDVPFSSDWHESAKYSSDDNNTCVWAVLKDKKTGLSAVYASTHLKPTGGYLARALTNYRQSIHLTDGLYKISQMYADENGLLPISVGGDFNLITTHEYNYAYPHMTEIAHYSDAQKVAEKTDKSGTARVWGKNKGGADDGSLTDGSRIDLFFTQGMRVKKYQCLNGVFMEDLNGVYYTSERILDGSAYDLSDHLPIMMDVVISNEREIFAPGQPYENTVSKEDVVVTDGESVVKTNGITFSGADIVNYFTENQYLKADAVSSSAYGTILRLMATDSCPNVYAYLDYAKLMADKGYTQTQIANVSKIKITYKTSFTVKNSEFVIAVLDDGNSTVNYGGNTSAIENSEAFAEKTISIKKTDNSKGKITKVLFGNMYYSEDFSGVCGLFKGDCIYIKSIEFIV